MTHIHRQAGGGFDFASICGRQLSRCGKARRSPLTSNATITTSVAPVSSKIPGNRLTRLSLSALNLAANCVYIMTTSNCSVIERLNLHFYLFADKDFHFRQRVRLFPFQGLRHRRGSIDQKTV